MFVGSLLTIEIKIIFHTAFPYKSSLNFYFHEHCSPKINKPKNSIPLFDYFNHL
jgi:hypothetical protein